MKKAFILSLLISWNTLIADDDLQRQDTCDTTHYISTYTFNLHDTKFNRLCVQCFGCMHERGEEISATWLTLDMIKRYQLPGHSFAIQLPDRDSLPTNLDRKVIEKVLSYLVTQKTMGLIMLKRNPPAWSARAAAWVADHIFSAADAKQSQLDTLRADLLQEYLSAQKGPAKAAKYKKADDEDIFDTLLPKKIQ